MSQHSVPRYWAVLPAAGGGSRLFFRSGVFQSLVIITQGRVRRGLMFGNPNFMAFDQLFLKIKSSSEHRIYGLLGVFVELLHLGFNILQLSLRRL